MEPSEQSPKEKPAKYLNRYMQPNYLLRFAFWWNEARLVVAAISLIWGAQPVLSRFMSSNGLGIYVVATVISGIAGAYLLFMWNEKGRKIFGGNDTVDLVAFLIATLSGVHLGLGGLLGTNIIISFVGYSGFLFNLAVYGGGILYLWSTWHLYKRYKEKGEQLF